MAVGMWWAHVFTLPGRPMAFNTLPSLVLALLLRFVSLPEWVTLGPFFKGLVLFQVRRINVNQSGVAVR